MKNTECIICRQASESVYSLPIGRVYYREPAYAGFKNMLYSEAHRIHLQHVEYREFNICDKCAAEEYKRLYRLRPFKVTSAPDLYLTLIVLLLAIAPGSILSILLRFSFITGVLLTALFFIFFMYLFLRDNKKKTGEDSSTPSGRLKGADSLISTRILDEEKEVLITPEEAKEISGTGTLTVERSVINHHMVLLRRILIFAAGLFLILYIKALKIRGL